MEYAIRRLVADADAEQRRRLAVFAVRSLTQLDGLHDAAEAELLPAAAHAFRSACSDPLHTDVDVLRDWIAEIESACVFGDDTSDVLVAALCGLTCWHRFLQDGTSGPIHGLAFTLLDVAGFEMYGAELNDDVLTNPRVIQQLQTITELLTGRDN
ncbi:hypothetical protein DEU38_1409 [Rhodococcus sp. AG1013]|uniref:hypothetical protein n=1 Tax=Rhodococcus sp. AG1013 TaxID=2183996 RepID=UPI000E0A0171|nr:hypothetical protein [Rhodococcus sp. AG1013]RDI11297.1 hypothetical protein DEU38_1409 [Rhodococcus sp. AG1013]